MAGKGHPLAKPALGTKRICTGCEAKFYDLGKDPIVCPSCDTVYVIAKAPPPRGGRAYAPRSAYDPKAQSANAMGTLKEADAPGVADDDKEGAQGDTEDAEVAEIEDVEADGTEEAGGVPMLEELDEK
jgi:uncharacterized protein (TIGR02300 family)